MIMQSHLNKLDAFKNDLEWLYLPDPDNVDNALTYGLELFNQICDLDYELEPEEMEDCYTDVSLISLIEIYTIGGYTLKQVLDLFKGGYIAFAYDKDADLFLVHSMQY